MTEKELKRLSRADLLEMLIDQSREMNILRERLAAAEEALNRREIIIGSAGSIAEAALRINGVFEAAQSACEQYIENVRLLSERQDQYYRQMAYEKSMYAPMQANREWADFEAEMQEEAYAGNRRRRRGYTQNNW